MPLSKETKDRITQEAHDWRKKRPIYTPAYVATGYISGAEAEAERAEALVECLLKIKNNIYTAGAVNKKIDETLTKYNNPK